MQTRPSDILVLSGRYPPTAFESAANHRVYCDRHGYTYVHCSWPTRAANPYLNKIEYVRHYYDRFEHIFWIDDDAFFIDQTQPLAPWLPPEGKFLSICASPSYKSLHTFVSSGQFMLRGDTLGRRFIDELLEVDLEGVRRWWRDDLGYFSNGDQDAMVFLLQTRPEYAAGLVRHPHQSFNSRLADLEAGEQPFVLHFTGRPAVKRADYKRAQRILGYGPALLPVEEERAWRVVRPVSTGRHLARLLRRRTRPLWESVRRRAQGRSRRPSSRR